MYLKNTVLLFLLAVFSNTKISVGATADTKWSFLNWNKDSAISWEEKWKIDHWAYPRDHQQDITIVNDPQYETIKVLRVTYPKDSYNPSSFPVGGVGFYAKPIPIPEKARIIKLTYQVYFPYTFEWKLGML
ncbi:hypothetical protein K450DRAFT_197087 [Umbelopsis ramanniana AG]|uniref:Polysaccharide lyase 14 domain-containing protein n=1 Tax=Umbelopsis ramanniana AG TaxID=1314678 RepID=A0AAD5EHG7_UMBRA|nr:uncharacterized protein K450DRAFT_197087 [Umbelopsis ramanniana AG]KAI8582355.1 hypothetical protein K450DRAFT_197087 [Umbelopsis ramanniana AG]